MLTQIAAFWFERLGEPNHLISTDVTTWTCRRASTAAAGRPLDVCRKTEVVPIECVVRGYLAGSGWQEYQQSGTVCGIRLPAGLTECDRLPEPIFTPSTKATAGTMRTSRSSGWWRSRAASCRGAAAPEPRRFPPRRRLRPAARHHHRRHEVRVGPLGGELILIDEVLTPDSSRFWPADQYAPGRGQPSFDKQFVRDWLSASGWDKNSPPPALPDDVVAKPGKYVEAYQRLTGRAFVG